MSDEQPAPNPGPQTNPAAISADGPNATPSASAASPALPVPPAAAPVAVATVTAGTSTDESTPSPPAPQPASATRIITGLVPAAPALGPSSSSAPRTLTPKPIAWRSWPIVDSKLEPVALVLVVLGAVTVVWRNTESPITAALVGLALAVAVWRHFVPTVFELSALGVTWRTLRRTRRVPWLSIDRYVIGRRGVFLSSSGAPLEALRGLYLPWGTHRDEVLTSLRYYLPRAEEVKA